MTDEANRKSVLIPVNNLESVILIVIIFLFFPPQNVALRVISVFAAMIMRLSLNTALQVPLKAAIGRVEELFLYCPMLESGSHFTAAVCTRNHKGSYLLSNRTIEYYQCG